MSGYSNECRKINTYNELLGDVSRGRFPLGVLGVAAVHGSTITSVSPLTQFDKAPMRSCSYSFE